MKNGFDIMQERKQEILQSVELAMEEAYFQGYNVGYTAHEHKTADDLKDAYDKGFKEGVESKDIVTADALKEALLTIYEGPFKFQLNGQRAVYRILKNNSPKEIIEAVNKAREE